MTKQSKPTVQIRFMILQLGILAIHSRPIRHWIREWLLNLTTNKSIEVDFALYIYFQFLHLIPDKTIMIGISYVI